MAEAKSKPPIVCSEQELIDEAIKLRARTYQMLLAAEKDGDLKTALAAVREARGCMDLLAKLLVQRREAVVELKAVPLEERAALVNGKSQRETDGSGG